MARAGKQAPNQVLAEHKQLAQDVAAVDDWANADTPRASGWGQEMSRRSATAVEHLRKHFGGEAEAELFEDFLEHSPHLVDKLKALSSEHAVIINELREVAEKSKAATGKDAERVAKKARAAVALLRRHEAEENELILRNAYEEFGGGD